jgi:hypothetical protein
MNAELCKAKDSTEYTTFLAHLRIYLASAKFLGGVVLSKSNSISFPKDIPTTCFSKP